MSTDGGQRAPAVVRAVLSRIAVEGYRSLRDVVVPLHGLDVVTGPNGSGKSSLYRALRLLAETGRGGAVAAMAREGGIQSALWAGPEHVPARGRRSDRPLQGALRTKPVSVQLGFGGEGFGYLIDLGLPVPTPGGSAFDLDPEIKREVIWAGDVLRPAAVMVQRDGPLVRARDGHGEWAELTRGLRTYDSMLAELADPGRVPEISTVRERLRSWRFYDSFRTDPDAPARQSLVGTRTPVLAHDGADLASALQTIVEVGDGPALRRAVDDAFPGSRLDVAVSDTRLGVQLEQPGMLRPLGAAELSDGTLRYLLLVAALLTPRPPELMVLNEPETSLHPDLLPALARLVVTAAQRSQLIVVSHSPSLVAGLRSAADVLELEKVDGETRVVDQLPLERPAWHWYAGTRRSR